MQASKVLEMLNDGRIEELKAKLADEIYADSLKKKPGAKSRYLAMKRYFKYVDQTREALQKPCPIKFEERDYTSFCNSWSLVLTKEDTGEIELFGDPENYPNVTRLIHYDGIKGKLNVREVIAEAKTKGYKLTKREVGHNFKYLMLYDGTYYKIGLLDASYRIIDDGEEAMTYHPDGVRMPLTIENSIGLCMIMPVKFETEPDDEKIIIEVK